MREETLTNFAFIDSQNVNLGIRELGWKLDWRKFRVFLKERYRVKTAYIFIGFMEEYQDLYQSLQKAGFVLIFKTIVRDKQGKAKGNVDADLVLQAMIEYPNYERPVIVSGDGDYYSLVRYLYRHNKLVCALSPSRSSCSALLLKTAKEKIRFMEDYKGKVEYEKK